MTELSNKRLLIIDDDTQLTELLVEYFQRFGLKLSTAETLAGGRRQIKKMQPDLLILDVMLPDGDGMLFCKELREQLATPIIMLTARGELTDKVLGLELGADDYVAKPFEPRELVARTQSILRRRQTLHLTEQYQFSALTLCRENREVSLNKHPIDLTTMEFELLMLFMSSPGRVLTRERLIDTLKGIDAAVFDRSVDMLVCRLREKLGDDPRKPTYIKTIRMTGYQFIAKANE